MSLQSPIEVELYKKKCNLAKWTGSKKFFWMHEMSKVIVLLKDSTKNCNTWLDYDAMIICIEGFKISNSPSTIIIVIFIIE